MSVITIREAKEKAKHFYRARIPYWLIGPPGIGKSDIWRQISKELNIGFIDLRVSQLDPVDLRGLPSVKDGSTTWNLSEFWPRKDRDGPEGIVLFDELADSSKAMQSACYQPILDHMIGRHKLEPGWYFCAASNDREHRAGAQSVSSALANRFAWDEVEPNWQVWDEDYAVPMGIHHLVRAYLKYFQDGLFNEKAMKAGERIYATPRGWSRAGNTNGNYCIMDAPVPLMYSLLRSNVGEGEVTRFIGYHRTLELPDLKDVVNNPKQCMIPKEPSSRYALACMLSRGMTAKNLDRILTYMQRPEFGREFEVTAMMEAVKRDDGLCETKAYTQFGQRNSDLHL